MFAVAVCVCVGVDVFLVLRVVDWTEEGGVFGFFARRFLVRAILV